MHQVLHHPCAFPLRLEGSGKGRSPSPLLHRLAGDVGMMQPPLSPPWSSAGAPLSFGGAALQP